MHDKDTRIGIFTSTYTHVTFDLMRLCDVQVVMILCCNISCMFRIY